MIHYGTTSTTAHADVKAAAAMLCYHGLITLTLFQVINFALAVFGHLLLIGMFLFHNDEGNQRIAAFLAVRTVPALAFLAATIYASVANWKQKPLAMYVSAGVVLTSVLLYCFDVAIRGPDITMFGPKPLRDVYLNWFWTWTL